MSHGRYHALNRYLRTGALCALLLGLAVGATAAEAPRYEVELILFRHLDDSGYAESSDANALPNNDHTAPAPPSNDRTMQAELLDEHDYRLMNEARSLAASQKHRLLTHIAWRQPVFDQRDAQAVPVNADSADFLVTGTVRLFRGRYLHLDADLHLHETPQDAPPQTFRLQDRQRIRAGELTYFDHPAFGMLVLVNPAPHDGEQAAPAHAAPTDEPVIHIEIKAGEEN